MKYLALLFLSLIMGCSPFPNYLEQTFEGLWSTPGLFDSEGNKYKSPAPNKTTGEKINVAAFGAKADITGEESFRIKILYSYKALEPAKGIPDGIEIIDSRLVTLILSNDSIENMYCEIYSKEVSAEDYRPGLLFVKD